MQLGLFVSVLSRRAGRSSTFAAVVAVLPVAFGGGVVLLLPLLLMLPLLLTQPRPLPPSSSVHLGNHVSPPANMDYVVDDVVRRVSSSSRRRNRGVDAGAVAVGGDSGSAIPAVVEAVLRIGGSAMGPALVCPFFYELRETKPLCANRMNQVHAQAAVSHA